MLIYNLRKGLDFDFEYRTASTLEEGKSILNSEEIDLMFLDLNLPDSERPQDTISSFFDTNNTVPILILTSCDKRELAEEAIKMGAQDFILKGTMPPASLARCVKFAQIRKDVQNKIIEEKEEAFRKNTFKSVFLASMSHDLRSPLSAMLNIIPMLRKDVPFKTKNELLNILENASNNQLQVVNDILDISRLEAGEIKVNESRVDLHKEINQLIDTHQILAIKKGIQLKSEIAPSIKRFIKTDITCIMRILGNLLNNAIKFTEEGSVTVKVDVLQGNLYVSVIDTGIGIPRSRQKAIFKMYEQSDSQTSIKYGGTGIGLSICKKRAEIMGGEIVVKSDPGKGSTFTFKFPYKPSRDQNVKQKVEGKGQTATAKSSLNILVVDDDHSNRVLVKHFLNTTIHNITVVNNGKEAVNACKGIHFDVIFMDMQMDVMNGFEATKVIREHEKKSGGPHKHIIAFTASIMQEEIDSCFSAGCDDILTKPFKGSDLIKKLNDFIEGQSHEQLDREDSENRRQA